VTGRNRTAAKGFLTDKVINAVPENFFGELGGGKSALPDGQTTAEPLDVPDAKQ
jgi:hypothetical protein